MSNNFNDRTLALSGVFHAACMVKKVAWYGKCDDQLLSMAVSSLLKQNTLKTEDVFSGDIANLKLGLEQLTSFFGNNQNTKDQEVTRYVLSILHLEKLLLKNSSMIHKIRNSVDRIQEQVNIFGLTHDNVIANVAGLYTDTISTFSFRIHVTGDPSILNNTHNANKVRALLLFGIRCAVLWRQLGGSKWQLVFSKKKTIGAAEFISQRIKEQDLIISD